MVNSGPRVRGRLDTQREGALTHTYERWIKSGDRSEACTDREENAAAHQRPTWFLGGGQEAGAQPDNGPERQLGHVECHDGQAACSALTGRPCSCSIPDCCSPECKALSGSIAWPASSWPLQACNSQLAKGAAQPPPFRRRVAYPSPNSRQIGTYESSKAVTVQSEYTRHRRKMRIMNFVWPLTAQQRRMRGMSGERSRDSNESSRLIQEENCSGDAAKTHRDRGGCRRSMRSVSEELC